MLEGQKATKPNVVVMLLVCILILGMPFRGMFAGESAAVKALKAQGFTDVEITDKAWLAVMFRGCDKRDAARFTATATNPIGSQVELNVCTGWPFKGATVRTR